MARDQTEKLGKDEEITAALIMVSQLRAVFSRLPHLGTPRERTELEEFHGYRRAAGPLAYEMARVRLAGAQAHPKTTESQQR